MKIYVASPLGFTEAGRHYYINSFLPFVKCYGQILDPWSANNDAGEQEGILQAHAIAMRNIRLIDSCDLLLAVLDGPDVDSGTASEVGYAFARGKHIVGYRSDRRKSGELHAVNVNLQVEYFVTSGGHAISVSLEALRRVLEDLP